MKKDELDELSKSLPGDSAKRILLPIIFLRRRDLGPGAYIILGDPYEDYATRLLTGGVLPERLKSSKNKIKR